MARKVKCQWCNEYKEKDQMIYLEVGQKKKIKKYYCIDNCYDEFLEDKAFKEKEYQELDKLVEVIKDIHDIEVIPGNFYPYIQELRNGDVLFGKKKKKYKQGIEYDLIAETYKYVQDSINWAKKNKDFNGALQELKYGLAIVKDKIGIIIKKRKRKEHTRVNINSLKNNLNVEDLQYENKQIQNKRHEQDISDFLD